MKIGIQKPIWISVLFLLVLVSPVLSIIDSNGRFDAWNCDEGSGVSCGDGVSGRNITLTSGIPWGSQGVQFVSTTYQGTVNLSESPSEVSFAFNINITTIGNGWTVIDYNQSTDLRIVGNVAGTLNLFDGGSNLFLVNTSVRIHLVWTCNGSRMVLYRDRVVVVNISSSLCIDDNTTELQLNRHGDDEISQNTFWFGNATFYNKILNQAEINNSFECNNITTCAPTSTPTINITYPINGTTYNINYSGWINVTATDTLSNIDNCTLNNTGWTFNTSTAEALSVNFTFFNSSIPDGLYSIRVTCNNTAGTSGTQDVTFTIDTTAPTITLNPNNAFNISNISNENQYDDTMMLNITFADETALHSYSINITRESTVFFNATNNTLSGTSFTFNYTINISSWAEGVYNITIWVSDAHTSKKIPDYDLTKDIAGLKLIFDTPDGNNIGIKFKSTTAPINLSLLNSSMFGAIKIKEEDRYIFWFNLSDLLPKNSSVFHNYTFKINAKNNLIYLPDSSFKAHFVTDPQWIDFPLDSTEDVTYSVSQKGQPNNYEVTITTTETSLYFASVGGLNKLNRNYTWYRGVTNQSHASTGIRTEMLNFDLNVSNRSTYISDINARFFYNMTEYTVTKTNYSNHFGFVTNLSINNIPGTQFTFDFTWNVTVTQANSNEYNFSLTNQQTIDDFIFRICNNTVTTITANYTFLDEINLTSVFGDFDSSTFVYWISDRESLNKTFTFARENETNFTFCISPENISINSNYNIFYSAPSYPQRRYSIDDAIFTNTPANITLYLLHTSLGIYARFRTIDQFQNTLTAVQATMTKTISGTVRTIQIEETDDAGIATFWVNPDDTYVFTFIKVGFKTATITIRPTSTDIFNVVMESETSTFNSSYYRGLVWEFRPKDPVLNNETLYDFTFNLTSSFWTITNCIMTLRNISGANLTQTTSFTSSSCNISINFNTSNNTFIISEVILEENNSVNITFRYTYSIRHIHITNFTLMTIFDDLTAFGGAGFDDFARALIAFLIIMGITFAAARFTGITNPDVLIGLIVVSVLLFSYIGWFTMEQAGIPSGKGLADLNKYLVFYVILIVSSGFIAWRHS